MNDQVLQAQFKEINESIVNAAASLTNLSKQPGVSEYWQGVAQESIAQLRHAAKVLSEDVRGSVISLETRLEMAQEAKPCNESKS